MAREQRRNSGPPEAEAEAEADGECLICRGPTTEVGACKRTLQALREERGGGPEP